MTACLHPLQNHLAHLRVPLGSRKPVTASLVFLLLFTACFAQYDTVDSLPSFLQPVYHQYMTRVGGSANLYNGAEYEGSYRNILGSPFWGEKGFEDGTVVYEGIVYYHVPLAYDLIRNELVTKSFQQASIRLETSKLNAFLLGGHSFIIIRNDTTASNPLPDDIYELLFNDPAIQVLAKQTKHTRRPLHAEDQDTIVSHTSCYIRYRNTNYPVDATKDLVHIFQEPKNFFAAFWKQNHLNFKKDPETFIIQTTQFWLEQKK